MRDYALIAVGVILGLCAPRYYREWADLLSNWRGHVRAWKVALRGGTPAEVEAAYGELDRSIQALAWAIDWIERIAEVPVPGTDEQEDWERFAAAQEILRTAATNQKEVGG